MKLGALGVPAYRTYSLKELEDATNNFDTSAFINDGPYSQVWQNLQLQNVKYIVPELSLFSANLPECSYMDCGS